MDFNWIENDADLAAAVNACGRLVALDTEFQRTDTFFPIAGLYQLASNDRVWLIDPLAISDFASFGELLEDPGTTVVMHACAEDLELLASHIGVRPRNVFDTQYANAFLSDRYSISYSGLVEQMLSIELPQGQTRSNWIRRPLKPAQLHYAANDVRYLPELFRQQQAQLTDAGRLDWFEEEMRERLLVASPSPEEYYRNIGKAWTLDSAGLERLRRLCAWREREAMALDIPRRRVVQDDHLFALAAKSRVDASVVAAQLPGSVAARFGDALVAALDDQDEFDQPPEVELPLTQREGIVVKQLRELGRDKAQELGIAPELLARKREVERSFRHFRDHGELDERLTGWRHQLIGEGFRNLLAAADNA